MKGPCNTKVANATTVEVLPFRQQCKAKAEVCKNICTSEFEKIRRNGISTGTLDDKPRPERLEVSKISNKQSKLQRDIKLRASIERITPKSIPDDDDMPSDVQESGEQISSEEIPDDDDTPSEEQEGDNGVPPQEIPEDDDIW